MPKRILFVIHRLGAGGAEKSLVSLLNSIPLKDFEVNLMAIDSTGIFRDKLPSIVKLVNAPRELVCQTTQIKTALFWKHANIKTTIWKIWTIISCRLRSKKNKVQKSHDQFYNDIWRSKTPDYPKQYDVAVSYMDCVNYYVIDHVKAKKKILWCHNDYNKLEYKPTYDHYYYEKADTICTISESCKQSLVENFPDLSNKFEVIENISAAKTIKIQAEIFDEMQQSNDGFMKDKRCKLVSIGRLTMQKGFDYAIDAAKILKEKGFNFCWYILGEGPLHKALQTQIMANNVSECVKLIGIRSNPYPYIKQADIFVMPSRYEGKSIALDEAKILCKPIVVTNYPSVKDAIKNGSNGIIVEINTASIAEGILRLNEMDIKRKLESTLARENNSNEEQVVESFMNLISS